MANIFKRVFGYQDKKPNISPMGLRGYTDTSTGSALNQRILGALNQGQNIGYGEDFVNRSTSPMVAQMRADLPNLTRDVEDYYASRGLSRSTPAARQIGEVRAQHGRDINSILANAYLMNEQQKKSDIGRYENLANTVAGQDLSSENAKLADIENAKRANYEAGIARDTANTGALNRAIGVPLAIGASVATGNPSFALGSLGIDTGGVDDNFVSQIINDILKKRSGGFVSGGVGALAGAR